MLAHHPTLAVDASSPQTYEPADHIQRHFCIKGINRPSPVPPSAWNGTFYKQAKHPDWPSYLATAETGMQHPRLSLVHSPYGKTHTRVARCSSRPVMTQSATCPNKTPPTSHVEDEAQDLTAGNSSPSLPRHSKILLPATLAFLFFAYTGLGHPGPHLSRTAI